MSAPAARKFLVVGTMTDAVRDALARIDRDAVIEHVPDEIVRGLGPAVLLVVNTAHQARIARAAGFDAGIVIQGAPRTQDETASLRLQGTHFANPSDRTAFARVVTEALENGPPDELLIRERARLRRLAAMGELAVTLRHALNNGLGALMAEAQMLEMDAADPDVRAAAGRILLTVRKLAELSRTLESTDGV